MLKAIDKFIDKFNIFKKILAANAITLKRYIYRFIHAYIHLYVSLLT